jgi:hypothetical protein
MIEEALKNPGWGSPVVLDAFLKKAAYTPDPDNRSCPLLRLFRRFALKTAKVKK